MVYGLGFRVLLKGGGGGAGAGGGRFSKGKRGERGGGGEKGGPLWAWGEDLEGHRGLYPGQVLETP